MRLSLLKGAVPTVLSSLSAPSLLSYAPHSLNPHLCFSASSHLICFPVPDVLSLACPCSLLLTCSCESSWNEVQPLTCLQSAVIWAQLIYSHDGPICQYISSSICFFFLRDHHHKLIRKNRKQLKSGDHTLHWSTYLITSLGTGTAREPREVNNLSGYWELIKVMFNNLNMCSRCHHIPAQLGAGGRVVRGQVSSVLQVQTLTDWQPFTLTFTPSVHFTRPACRCVVWGDSVRHHTTPPNSIFWNDKSKLVFMLSIHLVIYFLDYSNDPLVYKV